MHYDIVRYRPEFRAQILEIQKYLWSPNLEINAAYLKWKYGENPYTNVPHIYLALCDGKVVGMRGFYGAKWRLQGTEESLLCLAAGDLVIAPEHRNRGLLTQLMVVAFDDLAGLGFEYVLNLSGGPVTQLSSLATGWRSIGGLQRLDWQASHRKLSSPFARLLRLASKHRTVNKPFGAFDARASRKACCKGAKIAAAARPQPEAMALLNHRVEPDGRLRHDRSPAFFAWRFQNPRSDYRFIFWSGAELEGYVVLQVPLYRKVAGVNIVDWQVTRPGVLADLINAAIRYARPEKLSVVASTFANESKALLIEAGFREVAYKPRVGKPRPTVLVRPLCKELSKSDWSLAGRPLLDSTTWDVRMIDSDGV